MEDDLVGVPRSLMESGEFGFSGKAEKSWHRDAGRSHVAEHENVDVMRYVIRWSECGTMTLNGGVRGR